MANTPQQNITINHSILNDVQGNYYSYHGDLGAYGIHKLFEASCPAAFHDSQERDPPPRCLEGTRITILKDIYNWISEGHERILWVSGPAGSGKSAVAQTVADTCARDKTLAGSFFFLHGAQGRDTPDRLVASISYQIVTKIPEKRKELSTLIERDLSILHKSLSVQFQNLVIPLFDSISNTTVTFSRPPTPFLVIIDGLDECADERKEQDVIRCIGDVLDASPIPLRFIIVSRTELHIRKAFDRLTSEVHNINIHTSHFPTFNSKEDEDIRTYLRHELNRIYDEHELNEEEYWPNNHAMEKLIASSGGLFIYASTIIKYVGDPDFHPIERLNEVLNNTTPLTPTPFSELDHLYRRILGVHKAQGLLLRVLTVVCCHKGYIGPRDIDKLLELREGKTTTALRCMHSVLDLETLRFHHKSFTDFLYDKDRAGKHFIDKKKGHAFMAQVTLRYLSRDYTSVSPNTNRYACEEWADHCIASGSWDENPQLLEQISTMLGSLKDRKKRIMMSRNLISSEIWSWLAAREVIPAISHHNPLNIREQLFMMAWRQASMLFLPEGEIITLEGPIIRPSCKVFEIYSLISPPPFNSLFHKVLFTWSRTSLGLGKKHCADLVTRRLHQNRSSDVQRIRNGYAILVYICLTQFFYEHGFYTYHLNEYIRGTRYPIWTWGKTLPQKSLFNKYNVSKACVRKFLNCKELWLKRLPLVTPGHPILLKCLEGWKYLGHKCKRSTQEVQSVKAWLKMSQMKPEKYPVLVENGWLEPAGVVNLFERDIQNPGDSDEILQWSFSMAGTTWLQVEERYGLENFKMPFERDVEEMGRVGFISHQLNSLGMDAASL